MIRVITLAAALACACAAQAQPVEIGTVLKAIVQRGFDTPVGTTDANMTNAQMQQYAGFLPNEALFMSSEWPPHPAAAALDPKVEAMQARMFAAYRTAGAKPDIAVAHAWDPAMLAAAALRSAGPSASAEQIRAYLAAVSGWGGVNAVVTRWSPEAKTWTIVSKPGGAPL